MISDVISEDLTKTFRFCNEAIVRADFESDVKVAAFYPRITRFRDIRYIYSNF